MQQLLALWAVRRRRRQQHREYVLVSALASWRQSVGVRQVVARQRRRRLGCMLIEWAVAARRSQLASLRLQRHLETTLSAMSAFAMVARYVAKAARHLGADQPVTAAFDPLWRCQRLPLRRAPRPSRALPSQLD